MSLSIWPVSVDFLMHLIHTLLPLKRISSEHIGTAAISRLLHLELCQAETTLLFSRVSRCPPSLSHCFTGAMTTSGGFLYDSSAAQLFWHGAKKVASSPAYATTLAVIYWSTLIVCWRFTFADVWNSFRRVNREQWRAIHGECQAGSNWRTHDVIVITVIWWSDRYWAHPL